MANGESGQAMKTLFSAYTADDDDDLDDSRVATRQRGDSDASLSDMDIASRHSDEIDEKIIVAPGGSNAPSPLRDQSGGADGGGASSLESAANRGRKIVVPEAKRAATRLVSYAPDEQDDDDEDSGGEGGHDGDSSGGDDPNMFNGFRVSSQSGIEMAAMTKTELNNSLSSLRHSLSEDEVQLPPEPTGKCSMKLQDKVARLYAQVQSSHTDLSASIQRRKDFRNPSIYDKLVEFCGIDEKGTNYPPELYNPQIWGPESNYEFLAKQQKADLDRREKERREKQLKEKGLMVERVVGMKKSSSQGGGGGSSPEQKRRTKWDSTANGGGGAAATQISAVGPITKSKSGAA